MGGVGLIEPLDRGRGVRVGRLAVTVAGRQLAHAPRLDGCTTWLRCPECDLGAAYGGLCLRYGRRQRGEPQVAALVIAWRGARVPNPAGWWPPRRAWQLAQARRARRRGQLPQPRGFTAVPGAFAEVGWDVEAPADWPQGDRWRWPTPEP